MGETAAIETKRLSLRLLRTADARAITDGIADVAVLRNLTSPPFPYKLADAEWFIGEYGAQPKCRAIWTDRLIGVVTILDHDLGYWLGTDHWGQGYMTEAATALVAQHFAASDQTLTSGHVLDNTGSRHVLRKLGFRDTHRRIAHIPARGEDCEMQRMQLTRADWDFARDPRIDTLRLTLRPLDETHATALSALANDPKILRMLASLPFPFGPDQARAWMQNAPYKGRPGFKFGIWQDETLIGALGMGGYPVSTFYWLGQDYWGQGYATEAMRGFLADMLPRLGLESVVADAFAENPASHRVLHKLGFEKTGESMGKSRARLEPAPVIAYRLAAENLDLS